MPRTSLQRQEVAGRCCVLGKWRKEGNVKAYVKGASSRGHTPPPADIITDWTIDQVCVFNAYRTIAGIMLDIRQKIKAGKNVCKS